MENRIPLEARSIRMFMPFGLTIPWLPFNVYPTTYYGLSSTFAYLDDILIFSETLRERGTSDRSSLHIRKEV